MRCHVIERIQERAHELIKNGFAGKQLVKCKRSNEHHRQSEELPEKFLVHNLEQVGARKCVSAKSFDKSEANELNALQTMIYEQ